MTKAEKVKDVVVPDSNNVPVAIGAELFNMKDNMEGVEAQLPQIKVIHQGQMFAFPDESKVLSFVGTIIDMNRTNAYWAESFDESGGGDPPTCLSLDGVTPDMSSEEVQSNSGGCRDCPRNQYGSAGKRGKQCKNMKRMHILIEGSLMPYRLTVPPSNLKAVDLYVSLLTSQGVPFQLVETSFSLKSAKNKDGIEYSELVFKNIGPTPLVNNIEDAQKLKSTIGEWKGVMRGELITGEEV